MTTASFFTLAAVVVGSWNGRWFPSGRAEHRAAPEIEAATVVAAGRVLREGIDRLDPLGTNDLILCLNEMRSHDAAEDLCRAIGRTNLHVTVITGYRRRDRFDQQQDAIATTLPVASANWSKWKTANRETPPRGYACAKIILEPAVTATVYSVHLKSNYGQTTADLVKLNRAKRTHAINQLVSQEKPRRNSSPPPVIIAGDLNADKWIRSFSAETIFETLDNAGFKTPMDSLSAKERVTFPGRGKWSNTTFDYIYMRGFSQVGSPFVNSAEGVSDHNPVFVVIEPEDKNTEKKRTDAK